MKGNKFTRWMKGHSPQILTIFAIGGVAATAIVAVKRKTVFDNIIIEEERRLHEENEGKPEDEQEDISKGTVVKAAVRAWWPAIIIGVATGACMAGSTIIQLKHIAAVTSAYDLSRKTLKEYTEKVATKLTDKKRAEVEDEIAKDKMEKKSKETVTDTAIYCSPNGEQLFMDCWTGQFFINDLNSVDKAINELNSKSINGEDITLGDYLRAIGKGKLKETQQDEIMVWRAAAYDGPTIDIRKIPCIINDGYYAGRTCVNLKFATGSEPYMIRNR